MVVCEVTVHVPRIPLSHDAALPVDGAGSEQRQDILA